MEYKKTLNLPRTKFDMRARLPEREPKSVQRWEEMDLYGTIIERNKNKPKFVLHDGPPYANGMIHHGHVLNKTLKDIVVRYRNMAGYLTAYTPGWDCHGLPIEQQVLQNYKQNGMDFHDIPVPKIRAACRRYAQKYVGIQKQQFRDILCTGDWENPYLTLTLKYESTIAREMARWIEKGHLYKGFKPVLWDTVFETALAEAEIEYEDHESPSVYVKFPLEGDLSTVLPEAAGKPAFVVIWTTTPWTLPANLAIAFGPSIEYCAIEHDGEVFVFARGLLEASMKDIGWSEDSYSIIGDLNSTDMLKFNSRHPWIDRQSKHVEADYVTLEQGTGCVHTAPGHGEDDYITGLKNGLDILTPVDAKGCLTKDVDKYAGMFVFDANPVIVKDMHEAGILLNPPNQKIKHQYPHSWRSKKPVIFRATPQWFFKLDHNELRAKAIEEIAATNWIPHWGEARINGMVTNRPDWCISRQRAWGVPIPTFTCTECEEDLVDAGVAHRMADLFAEHTSDIWFQWEAKDLLPEGTVCPKCGGTHFKQGSHIVDVWFDSGVSWAAVCEDNEMLGTPVDLYLEGSDQHRGWFHSSLLCSVATRGKAPYKTVLTHGFVVNEHGRKYSKSSRNYVPIEKITKKYGAEILRMWVVSEDYRNDIRFSDTILSRMVDAYRKIRNTFRFLLGNISDYNPVEDRVGDEALESIDRWALMKLRSLVERFKTAYETYDLHVIYHSLVEFCTNDLSAFYLDIIKDRIYVEKTDSATRRAAQRTMYEIASVMSRMLAPVLPHTTEEIWAAMPAFEGKQESIHLEAFPTVEDGLAADTAFMESWGTLIDVRDDVLKKLEEARRNKEIGHSLDARVKLYAAPEKLRSLLAQRGEKFMADLFIVSQVEFVGEPDDLLTGELAGLHMGIGKARGKKCDRCWIYHEETGSDDTYPDTCPRCAGVLHAINFSPEDE